MVRRDPFEVARTLASSAPSARQFAEYARDVEGDTTPLQVLEFVERDTPRQIYTARVTRDGGRIVDDNANKVVVEFPRGTKLDDDYANMLRFMANRDVEIRYATD